ncbi:MAG TPA: hypothetical protein VKQ29_04980 [Aliidongia sp.]|nr:hypothetical protein [Aliidongia sp.]
MSKPPDLEALARRYVELWQDQIAATAVDPELTDGLARMMHLVGGSLAAQASLWQTLWPDLVARAGAAAARPAPPPANPPEGPVHDPVRRPESRGPEKPEARTPGSAPVAGAPADGGHDMAQLQARLALLEERLASLEGGSGAARRGTRPRTGRRRAS